MFTCQICFQSSSRKNRKRDNYQSIEKAKFLKYALEWKKVDHEYNIVHNKVDWNSDELFGHKNCKGIFFKVTFLSAQTPIVINPVSTLEEASETDTLSHQTSLDDTRKNNRQKLAYSSSRLHKKFLKCIICNEEKREKGRSLPLTLLTFENPETKTHKAEETLIRFSHIHKEKSTVYKDSAERILLTKATNSLFSADVAYHHVSLPFVLPPG